MALTCVSGGRACTGCMACRPIPRALGRCVCGEPVYEEDDRYCIDGEHIHWECLGEWAEQWRAGPYRACRERMEGKQ